MKSTSERREQTLSMLRKQGSVQVAELAAMYNVSTVTIRNDLAFFEKQGIATRAYGGAFLNESDAPVPEHSIEDKSRLNRSVKDLIGQAAAKMVNDGDTIILDSGTTTHSIAEHLIHHDNVIALTNGLNVANTLVAAEGVEVIVLGGHLRRKSLSFYGGQAEQALDNYHFNKLFLAVDGFELAKGITTHSENEARLNRRMCDVADEIIVVTDSSKFGRISLHKILEPGKVHKVITDKAIPERYLDGLRKAGIEVILVDA
ncbi:transcriptional repressor AgaR [Photobacterium sp. SP02]|uniref:DeoR family transcriptional regulator n=1 Tax=Photobacterium halotolerans TaxID=265726 RepID=A0A7X5AUJ3_9GAMM|nr:transcriptional repressor AgaR [Photobacterium halotolerans]NAW66481.1 DeoR family transcriptional regulator [Photobacterium halotolerans]NAW87195.1 DeoR family transcriptional regulator [Photobacterium halotolerans]